MAGSINSTTQSLDQYLQQRLSNLESEFLQFKNRQPVGSDVVQAITMTGVDGSVVGMGPIPGESDSGFFTLDSLGRLVSKQVGATQYVYDPTTGKNIMQIGKLPDGTYGWAVAAAGFNVADGFS